MQSPEQNFEKLGLTLPPAPKPLGVYKPCLIDGKYLYLSGHGTVKEDGNLIIGRIGEDLDIEQGKLAARQVGLAMLATIKAHIGSLDKIKRVIKVLGMVNCVSSFERHPYVINGASELLLRFGVKKMESVSVRQWEWDHFRITFRWKSKRFLSCIKDSPTYGKTDTEITHRGHN